MYCSRGHGEMYHEKGTEDEVCWQCGERALSNIELAGIATSPAASIALVLETGRSSNTKGKSRGSTSNIDKIRHMIPSFTKLR